jgi:hypothetical protein
MSTTKNIRYIDSTNAPAKDIDVYIAKTTEEAQARRRRPRLRSCEKQSAPKAVEVISYRVSKSQGTDKKREARM